jgi:hypothetical protein
MSFLSRFRSKFRKDGDARRVDPTVDPELTDFVSVDHVADTAPSIEADIGLGSVADPNGDTAAPRRSFGLKLRPHSGKKTKSGAAKDVIIGLQLVGSESWLRLNADGHAEEIPDLPVDDAEASSIFGKSRVFRGMDYDRGLKVSTKLRGKALRNNLMRELNDIPIWFKKESISWFTRRDAQSILGYPVHPLAAALWQFAKGRGSTPTSGLLLRLRFPMGSTVLWVFLAMGANGVGAFQSIRTSAEANRPTFNPQLAAGLLGNEPQSLDVDPADLWSFLASSPTQKVPTYPQNGEWLGKPKTLIGKIVASGGLAVLVIGAGFWFWSEVALHHAMLLMRSEAASISRFKASQRDFFSTHIEGIALLQKIPLGHLIGDASSIWKPGTTVTMADGIALPMSTGPGPVLAMPGSVETSRTGGSSGARFSVDIPVTKNLGPGQAYWVSQSLLHAVISQTPPPGIFLQSVQKTGGNGYVALFGGR